MKKLYILLFSILVISSCKEETPSPVLPVPYLPKTVVIKGGGAENHIALLFSEDNLTSYTPDNGGDSYKFTYDAQGKLTQIERTGSLNAIYEILYNGDVFIRTNRKVKVNNSWVIDQYYTYNRQDNKIITMNVLNPETNAIVQTYSGEYAGILVKTTSSSTVSEYWWADSRPRRAASFQGWFFPEMPVCLLELPSLERSSINGTGYLYSYEY